MNLLYEKPDRRERRVVIPSIASERSKEAHEILVVIPSHVLSSALLVIERNSHAVLSKANIRFIEDHPAEVLLFSSASPSRWTTMLLSRCYTEKQCYATRMMCFRNYSNKFPLLDDQRMNVSIIPSLLCFTTRTSTILLRHNIHIPLPLRLGPDSPTFPSLRRTNQVVQPSRAALTRRRP